MELISGPAWLVRSHEHARTVLGDARFSADDSLPGFPRASAVPPGGLSFLREDPPRHSVLRRVLTSMFTVHNIEKMRPGITAAAEDLISGMKAQGPPLDLVEHFALPLPSLVICQLLGVPYQDHEVFQQQSKTVVSTSATEEEAGAALLALGDYLRGLAEGKRRSPGDDALSRIVTQQDAADMGDEEVVAMARLLLIAGHETTANMISMIVLSLFQSPAHMQQLRDDPALLKGAVEESLRHVSLVRSSLVRLATADVPLGGIVIREGEGVLIGTRGANHDPAVYPDPHTIDYTRDSRGHIAFGYGVHQCLGQALARLELTVAVRMLLDAFPHLAPTDLHDVVMKEDSAVYGVSRMPVTW
ncbi:MULTISPECIES: cytochrome P450 [Streptomyces]|uniref:cytochrome P450 n=1 Tax=Streptomyces TaxID=1883 RepID=UPI00224949AB|nr:cytochrome P450 [Streptomyces sp. JHD 1]MCX2971657.1 cytochrome P450 [Streptomyces sp. JHD 1]